MSEFCTERMELVHEFMSTFKQDIAKKQNISDLSIASLRVSLIDEELRELVDAINMQDKAKVLDALVDLEYVLLGAVLAMGFQDVFPKAFLEAHKSNMSKLTADGQVIYSPTGKVLKSPEFKEPNFQQFIEE